MEECGMQLTENHPTPCADPSGKARRGSRNAGKRLPGTPLATHSAGPLAARRGYPTGKIDGAVRSRICSTSAAGRPTSRIQEKVRS
jgi:hypothetical protein